MKFTIHHTWAQEEHREWTIEAKDRAEADKIFVRDYEEAGLLWKQKPKRGDVLVDKYDVRPA